ncbi:MAG: hypothetical protein AAF997_10130 [Myxococcota bacterium]
MFLTHISTDHAEVLGRALVAACRLDGWQAPTQPRLLTTLFHELLGKDYDFETLEPNAAEEAATVLESPEERHELVQLMCMVEILCTEASPEMEQSVAAWATKLGVPERSLVYLRDLAEGEVRKTLEDFYRLNWIGDLSHRTPGFAKLRELGAEAYASTVEVDPDKAARYDNLKSFPEGSLGRYLYEFYQERGFAFPGEEGAASEAVAHHDWIHLLADYGTTPLGEIEVLSFMNGSSRSPGVFLGLIGALALFESAIMGEGFVTVAYPGQGLSRDRGPDRMAEAVKRGNACKTDLLLDVEFFSMADEPLVDLRERFEIPPRSDWAQALDPWGALGNEPVPPPGT